MIWRMILVVISAVVLGAHFLRAEQPGLALVCLAAPLLLLWRTRWTLRAVQVLLAAGGLVWIDTAVRLAGARMSAGAPWLRMALILGAVAAVTWIAACVLGAKRVLDRYPGEGAAVTVPLAAFLLTASLLSVVHVKVRLTLLLAERFLPGSGWMEILALAAYAAWVAGRMLDQTRAPAVRLRTWLLFSAVFFVQLGLGLGGVSQCLQTGKLHLPVPAVIVAGPLFRGEGLFMVILFLAMVAVVGPAWCSHLCYLGGWDALAAAARKRPSEMPRWRRPAQLASLALVAAAAVGLREAGVDGFAAAWFGLGFGVAGVGIMATLSRKKGVMVHCTSYCPIGLVATWLGRINPFRVRLNERCTECGLCRLACRYDALSMDDIRRRRPGPSCTLCGDCLAPCRHGAMEYRFPGLSPSAARAVFLVLVASLHAVFLAIARI
jgi:ferredoxin